MGNVIAWLIESSLLVLIIFTIRKIFAGKISYAGIYALWLVVLVRFLVPVNFISTPISAANICSGMFSAWDRIDVFDKDSKSGIVEGGTQQDQKKDAAASDYAAGEDKGNYQKTQQAVNGKKNSRFRQKTEGEMYIGSYSAEKAGRIDWGLFLRRMWVTVSVILFLWLVWSNAVMLQKMKKTRVLYGQRGRIKIYTVSGIKTPCLYGFFHPAVYLPASFVVPDGGEKISGEDLEQMITHEFVHYIHKDHIWALLRILLVSVYWFDPFVWLASSCSKKDAELFCDETVIRLLGEEKRFTYGEMLVRLAGEADWGDFRFSMMPMSRKGREMERRIYAISEKRHYSKWILVPLTVVLLAAMSITCSAGITTIAKPGKQIKDTTGNVSSGAAVSAARVSTGQAAVRVVSDPAAADVAQEDQREMQQEQGIPADTQGDEGEIPVYADTEEKAFYNYIEIFTDAVNTGNIQRMNQVLDVNSDVYQQQCDLVKNYFKRGIREKVKDCSISSIRQTQSPATADSGEGTVQIDSREKIRVFYEDGSSRLVKQKYCYTCAYIGGGWVITDMEDIS